MDWIKDLKPGESVLVIKMIDGNISTYSGKVIRHYDLNKILIEVEYLGDRFVFDVNSGRNLISFANEDQLGGLCLLRDYASPL